METTVFTPEFSGAFVAAPIPAVWDDATAKPRFEDLFSGSEAFAMAKTPLDDDEEDEDEDDDLEDDDDDDLEDDDDLDEDDDDDDLEDDDDDDLDDDDDEEVEDDDDPKPLRVKARM